MRDHITDNCCRVKEKDSLISLLAQMMLTHSLCGLHVGTFFLFRLCHIPHPAPVRRPRRGNYLARLRHKHRWYHLLWTFQFLLGLWAEFIVVCSVREMEARAFGPGCWSILLLLISTGCHLIEDAFLLCGTSEPRYQPESLPKSLVLQTVLFWQFCLILCWRNFTPKFEFFWAFFFFFFSWLHQGKNQFVVNSIFFLHVGVLPIGEVFTLILASFIAAPNAVSLSALRMNNR